MERHLSSVTSFLLKIALSLFAIIVSRLLFCLISSALSNNLSKFLYLLISSAAVLIPIPGAPGMLSEDHRQAIGHLLLDSVSHQIYLKHPFTNQLIFHWIV